MAFPTSTSTVAIVGLIILCLVLATARLVTILPTYRRPSTNRKRGDPTHLLVVLGSGGHTAEMIVMLTDLSTWSYRHRTYIVSEGDSVSAEKARRLEETFYRDAERLNRQDNRTVEDVYGSYSVQVIPRARKVHQSLLTTPFSCLRTFIAAIRLLYRGPGPRFPKAPRVPDLILTNGPATSAILIFASLALRFFDVAGHDHGRTRILYVESFARVKTLSLSARVVAWAVDRLLVQWEQLHGLAEGKAEYAGLLIMSGIDKIRQNMKD
jgi:beta-1,4-N-acetylglucosaminyltransferase